MADLKDVEAAIVSTIAQIIYPTGTANPSLTGQATNIYRGWPIPANLDHDLAGGTINISVFAQDNETRVTRFPQEWQALALPANTLTAAVSGQTVTLGGTVSTPQNIAVSATGKAYAYAVQAGDTTTSIATALAQLVNIDQPASSSGALITIPAAWGLSATVGGAGTMIRELRRQKRGFIVSLWCPDPDTRDNLAGPLDEALAEIDYLTLADGSSARLLYEKTMVIDRSERDDLYRRDLFYSVEYATTQTGNAYQIVDPVLNLGDFAGRALAASIPRGDALELESGGYILMENGYRLLLDDSVLAPHQDSLQLENGGYLLTETGDRLLLEYGTPFLLGDGSVLQMADATALLLN